ncbi:AraC family transcriptional regulator [Pseudomonas sp. LA21]|uniref:AraC family transcriptional regulator n=1 Tax=unclassified Pseudomonas TaxID=196821 RepID=UPI001FB7C9BC|nr:AraC family transcriptional regulator [Pseudomonas sp. LA21]MCJ1887312.1 AraC family transcriptional regulator [Pseudomonas sp. LA21]
MAAMARAVTLTTYAEVAQHLGLNVQQQLSRFGLHPAMLENPDLRIPLASVTGLLESSAQASGCETFGLRMAESRQLSNFGAISLLLSHQPTLRAALDTALKYRHLMNESVAIQVEESERVVTLRVEIAVDNPAPLRQSMELAIGVLHRFCGALLGQSWRPLFVSFAHLAPANQDVHRRLFGCRLEFGGEFNGIVCPAANLNAPNPSADPVMAKYARSFVESLPDAVRESTMNDVRHAIYLLLPMGRASAGQVAQSLGITVRTMQRRIEECGTSYSDLHDEVRQGLLVRYMDNPRYSLSQIACLLGFSSPSSFTRWFSSHHGMAPTKWRSQQPGHPA